MHPNAFVLTNKQEVLGRTDRLLPYISHLSEVLETNLMELHLAELPSIQFNLI
jgi:hypothetical protein